ncbi:hypothetical protein [Providencia sp. SP181]|uniref:hypothetical protein n=1 Tax=Providencia sp. SP181 TaxID=3136277 RepID=UPI003D2D0E0B
MRETFITVDQKIALAIICNNPLFLVLKMSFYRFIRFIFDYKAKSTWLGISINEVTYESSVLGAMFLLNSDYLSVD